MEAARRNCLPFGPFWSGEIESGQLLFDPSPDSREPQLYQHLVVGGAVPHPVQELVLDDEDARCQGLLRLGRKQRTEAIPRSSVAPEGEDLGAENPLVFFGDMKLLKLAGGEEIELVLDPARLHLGEERCAHALAGAVSDQQLTRIDPDRGLLQGLAKGQGPLHLEGLLRLALVHIRVAAGPLDAGLPGAGEDLLTQLPHPPGASPLRRQVPLLSFDGSRHPVTRPHVDPLSRGYPPTLTRIPLSSKIFPIAIISFSVGGSRWREGFRLSTRSLLDSPHP